MVAEDLAGDEGLQIITSVLRCLRQTFEKAVPQRRDRQIGQRGAGGRKTQIRLQPRLEIEEGQGVQAGGGERSLRIEPLRRDPGAAGDLRAQPDRERGAPLRWIESEQIEAGEQPSRGSWPVRAPVERLQVPCEIKGAALAAADLAAGGLGDRPRAEQDHTGDAHAVLLGDGPPDRIGDRCKIARLEREPALDLVDKDEVLLPLLVDGERRSASGAQGRMGPLRGQLQVLGIVVAPAQDDQVLETAGDEKLPVPHESEIPGAQERPAAIVQQGSERLAGLRGPVPVARGHGWPGDPDLPDLFAGTGAARLRIDDAELVSHGESAAAHRRGVFAPWSRGDEERGLGQAVAGEERLPAEAAGREGLGEAPQSLAPDRLGTVERHAPR